MSVRTRVNLTFGILATTVSVDGALESITSNRTVCIGPSNGRHPAVRITQPITCEHCGVVHTNEAPDQIRKAREVGDNLVVLDPEQLAIIKDVSEFTHNMSINPHPAEQVEMNSVPGEKVYYLVPARNHEGNYVVLAQLVMNHPEIAFMVRWAARTRVSVYRLSAALGEAGPVLVLFERIASGRVRTAPVVRAEVDSQKLALAEQVLTMNRRAMVTAFDPDAYLDDTETRIQELLARSEHAVTATTGEDAGLLALQQMVQEAKAKAPTRRRKTEAA